MSATFDHALLESGERRTLREAVAALGRRYGREYFTAAVREGRQTDALWQEAGRLGYLGVNLPQEYGGGGAGLYELAIVLEELGATGCPLLLMVVSPAICGTVIARFGTEAQKRRWLPGLSDGVAADGVRHHRAGRRLQLAPHHHHRAARRRRLAAVRAQGVHLRGGHRRRHTGRRPHRGRPHRAAQALPVHRRTRHRGLRVPAHRRWSSRRRRSSSSSSWTTCGCPPRRWSATRTPGCCSCSPGSTRSG